MKNLLIVILTLITGYLAYPIYQLKQAEKVIEDELKNTNIDNVISTIDDSKYDIVDSALSFLQKNLMQIDTKNDYPIFYIKITIANIKILNETSPIILKNTINIQRDYLCQQLIDRFKDRSNTTKQAFINILAKDNVSFEVTLAKPNGSKITQYQQTALDCLGLWATSN